MSTVDRSLDAVAFVSDHFREIARRRFGELAGLGLLTLALIAAVALATWSVQDPSLSHATRAPVHNLLGTAGAIAADLLMQLFGLASTMILLPVALAGWRLLAHKPLGGKLRQLIWIAVLLSGAAFASCLPRAPTWPLPTGLGGVLGDALLRAPALLGITMTGWTLLLGGLFLGALTIVLFVAAAGLQRPERVPRAPVRHADLKLPDADHEDDEDREGWFSLGGLLHTLLSLKARLGRMMRSAPRVPARMTAPGTERVMPRMPVAPRIAPVDEDDEEDIEAPVERAPPRKASTRAARRSSSGYQLPSVELLAKTKQVGQTLSSDQIQENAVALESVLGDFGVKGEIINARPGPVVTLYELEPAPGIKSSRVIGLADDIARSMSAVSARVAVVSGRNAIGIELPNPTREKVYFREQLSSREYDDTTAKLPLCLGKTIGGEPVIVDLARMPHLLIAGTTGSGKSVAINTMLLSLLYKLRPDQCRLIMVDPKMLELSVYDGIPHLLTPVVTDP
jgi:S-DNA-T family DNA segregation ATPase FtsK/SpoIIIE